MKKLKYLIAVAITATVVTSSFESKAAAAASGGGGDLSSSSLATSFLEEKYPWLVDLGAIYPATAKGSKDLPEARVIEALKDVHYKRRSATDPEYAEDMAAGAAWTKEVAEAYLGQLRSAPQLASAESQAVLDGVQAEIDQYDAMGPFYIPSVAKYGTLVRLAAVASVDDEVSDAGVDDLLRVYMPLAYAGPVMTGGALQPSAGISLPAMADAAWHEEGLTKTMPQGFYDLSKIARGKLKDGLTDVAPVMVPYLGGKVGLTTITLMIIEDLHNVSLPTKAYMAHGLKMSPRDFMVHDIGHHEVSSTRDYTKAWAGKLAKELMDEDKLNYLQATHIAARVTMLRYQQARDTASMILRNAAGSFMAVMSDDAADAATRRAARRAYNSRLAALFYACHEVGYINEDVLNANSQTEAARALLSQVVDDYTGEEPAEEVDPFNTHPVTGVSVLTEAERYAVLDGLKVRKKWFSDEDKTFGDVRPVAMEIKMEVSPVLINATAIMADGKEVEVSKQTSRLTYGDALDNNGLLRLAGARTAVPDFTGDDHATACGKAYAFIAEVRGKFRALGVAERDKAVAELDAMNVIPEGEEGAGVDVSKYILRRKTESVVDEVHDLTHAQRQSVLQRLRTRFVPAEEVAAEEV